MQTCPRAPGSSASLASSQRYLTERQQSTKTRTDRKHRLRTTNVSCTKQRTKIAGRLPAHQRHSRPAPRDRPGAPSRQQPPASLPPALSPEGSIWKGRRLRWQPAGKQRSARRTEPPSRVRHSRGGRRPPLRAGAGRGAAPHRARLGAPRRAGSDVPPPRKGGRCPARLCRRSHVAAVSGGRRGRHGARRGEVAARPEPAGGGGAARCGAARLWVRPAVTPPCFSLPTAAPRCPTSPRGTGSSSPRPAAPWVPGRSLAALPAGEPQPAQPAVAVLITVIWSDRGAQGYPWFLRVWFRWNSFLGCFSYLLACVDGCRASPVLN